MKTYQVITAASTFPVTLTEAKAHLRVDTSADDTYITSLIKAATQLCEEYTNRFFIDTVIEQYASSFKELETLFKSKVSSVANVKYFPGGATTIPSIITLDNAGSGYTVGVNTNLECAGGNGSGAKVNATADTNGNVTSVELVVAGSGYSLNDTLTILSGNNDATFKISSLGGTENSVLLDSTIYNTQLNYEPSQIQLADGQSFPNIAKRNDAVFARYTVGYGSIFDVPDIIKQAILLTIGNLYENRSSVVIGRIATELPQNVKWLLNTYKVQIVG
tara:strand:+ start:368 stop:1195 length:828 start_codon:yes stop_codon:yes gene_type:complete